MHVSGKAEGDSTPSGPTFDITKLVITNGRDEEPLLVMKDDHVAKLVLLPYSSVAGSDRPVRLCVGDLGTPRELVCRVRRDVPSSVNCTQ